MGPLVLLSLLGIGAATAVVDVMGSKNDSETDEATESETDESSDTDQDTDTDLIEQITPPSESVTPSSESSDAAEDDNKDGITGSDDGEALTARGTENIFAGDGADTLIGSGSGDLHGEDGNDALKIGGTVDGFGGDGDDYMHISQAARGFGGDGDDTFFLKASQSADGAAAQADGGDGDDTFLMRPLSGLPEDTLPHVLTGGAGADIYALDIDDATGIRDGEESDNPVVARITDFNTEEDMLLVDIGVSAKMSDLNSIPTPSITTTTDPDGAFTDVHISWENPLNPDNVETRTLRLEGVTDFSAEDVELTSIVDPNGDSFEQQAENAQAHKLFALKPVEGSAADDTIATSENALVDLQDGNDTLSLGSGTHVAHGGDGNDTITVSEDSDGAAHLIGGDGDDVITADLVKNSDTVLLGGEGDDTITFGMGHYVDGNAGEDTLVLNVHADAVDQGPAVLRTLTGNHLTINIPADLEGEVDIVNHTYGNGFEVSYSEIFVGDVPVLKLLEEDFQNGVGIAENDSRLTILRQDA
ncbi:hypothetical protein J7413_13055 [Shimia sp. R10_1]|uniref:hypothetical protein n=1 Tax=Shimia sp. R10_1 TaxID=2821095 RepID=UPI001ADB5857|nr:hypothetical protein [Shimia sp. R10_1]MBO9474472.1 hypothetical protein [Shimia sp. R10_1]